MSGPVAGYDLVVVGAGINGVAIARDAARRGLRVAVVERDDIGAETSSWSSRMIHGGLRYLEQYDLRLVRESLVERELLFRNAGHLVRPMRLLIPIYRDSTRSPRLVKIGMALYDVLSYGKSVDHHHTVPTADVAAQFPGLRQDGLLAALTYTDGQVECSERLCVEQALDAAAHGARLLLHQQVVDVRRAGPGLRLTVAAVDGSDTRELDAAVVINAAGPWVDDVLHAGGSSRHVVGGTKGSHIALPRFPGAPSRTVHFETENGKPLLIIPWRGVLLVGSTDVASDGERQPRISDEERRLLLDQVNRMFPGADLGTESVLFSCCGVRPLPHAPGKAATAITRRHGLDLDPAFDGKLISIIGGKLTTHRRLAEEAVDRAVRALDLPREKSTTARARFPGWLAARSAGPMRDRLTGLGCTPETAAELVAKYGALAEPIANDIESDRTLGCPLAGLPVAAAEVVNAVEREFARDTCDIIYRRMAVRYDQVSDRLVDEVEAVAGERFGWDEQRLVRGRRRIADLRRRVAP